MTRKDFILIAHVLLDSNPKFATAPDHGRGPEAQLAWARVVRRMSAVLAEKHPAFQPELFLVACGI